ncbi:hypothetical protein LTR04_005932 [Oleoguttula sp. CCFEE 6159]|nr:hypothetical protein LTR04_005932 [Oleoguttula sp. CCFEE 6159]
MANSDVDQKILGRLAELTSISNPLLSSCLHQVLGLSVLLSRKLFRARKLRKLDTSRDTKSLSLYHHIIWLSREGLSIVEVYVLPYTQDGQQGPECQIMAAKLRASFYHVFCLFHNHPPISQLGIPSFDSFGLARPLTPRANNGQTKRQSPGRDANMTPRARKSALRDAIPSMTSEASYITNPYAVGGPVASPPPTYPPPPPPPEGQQKQFSPPTSSHPPGLAPVVVPASLASTSFLLPPLNFVPRTTTYFQTACALAQALLPGSHPLRLSVALEQSAFLWDCARDYDRARRSARQAIKDVYEAPEGMNDAEFEDAAALVGALGAIVKRSTADSTPKTGSGSTGSKLSSPRRDAPAKKKADDGGASTSIPPLPTRSTANTGVRKGPRDRTAASSEAEGGPGPAPARSSPRGRREETGRVDPVEQLVRHSSASNSSSNADKASKRARVERAEEAHRRSVASSRTSRSSAGRETAASRVGVSRASAASRQSDGGGDVTSRVGPDRGGGRAGGGPVALGGVYEPTGIGVARTTDAALVSR